MKDFLARLFGRPRQIRHAARAEVHKQSADAIGPDALLAVQPGDLLRQAYEVRNVLGAGGCGIVYLVYSRPFKSVFALKTFRDEFLEDPSVRERFRKEAEVWINLERHPFLVRAHFVEDIEGRLFVGMDYVAPNELGMNSLSDYIQYGSLPLEQCLRWAIQFCHGMEHAYQKGLRCHRDIKPANIMIDSQGILKITDFGLAGVLHAPTVAHDHATDRPASNSFSSQTMQGMSFGTPTHMPPEQFVNAATCDQRSDIYSFGVVLYQMQQNGALPFLAPSPRDNSGAEQMRFWQQMFSLHAQSPTPALNSPLTPIIRRCLEKAPANRYQTFRNLRNDLERLLLEKFGKTFIPPAIANYDAWEWNNKGGSHQVLGDRQEALRCYEKALELAPWFVEVWANKSVLLQELGHLSEAMDCINKALAQDPTYAHGLCVKANLLNKLHRFSEAIEYFDKSLGIDDQPFEAWLGKGDSLMNLARYGEALSCFDRSLILCRRAARTLHSKAICLLALNDAKAAIECCDKALEVDPGKTVVLTTKATAQSTLGQLEAAYSTVKQALSTDKRDPGALFAKAGIEGALGRSKDSLESYREFLKHSTTEDPEQIDFAKQCIRTLEGHGNEPASIRLAKERVAKTAAASFGKAPHTKALGDLAEAYKALGQYDRAIQTHKESILILEEKWGPNGLVMAMAPTLNNLAVLYHQIGKLSEAKALYERAIMLIEGDESYGPRDLNLTRFLINLAEVQADLGSFLEAQSSCERALSIIEHALGSNAAELLSPLGHYANVLRKNGRNTQAGDVESRIRQLQIEHK